MPKILTRTIKTRGRKPTRDERAQSQREEEQRFFDRYKRAEARAERAKRHYETRSDGVTRCSKCPPTRCCDECARINNGRQIAGLIRPRGSPEPHPNNILWHLPDKTIKSRPRTPETKGCFKVVSIEVKPLGGGWYLGQALLSGEPIYERKFRSREAARRYAVNSMVDIREGLRFEESLR